MISISFRDALTWEGSSSSRAIHTWQIDIVTDNSLPSKCIWEHKAHINIVEHIPLSVIHFCPSASCSPEGKIISLGVICLTDPADTKLFPFYQRWTVLRISDTGLFNPSQQTMWNIRVWVDRDWCKSLKQLVMVFLHWKNSMRKHEGLLDAFPSAVS